MLRNHHRLVPFAFGKVQDLQTEGEFGVGDILYSKTGEKLIPILMRRRNFGIDQPSPAWIDLAVEIHRLAQAERNGRWTRYARE